MRKYERYWALLKRDKRIVIQLQSDSMSPAKAEVACKKLARGIQKEKYQDIVYRSDSNRKAVLHSSVNYKNFTVTFTLSDSSLVSALPERL